MVSADESRSKGKKGRLEVEQMKSEIWHHWPKGARGQIWEEGLCPIVWKLRRSSRLVIHPEVTFTADQMLKISIINQLFPFENLPVLWMTLHHVFFFNYYDFFSIHCPPTPLHPPNPNRNDCYHSKTRSKHIEGWNSLPQDLRHCSTLSSFKAKLKTFLFSQYFHPN